MGDFTTAGRQRSVFEQFRFCGTTPALKAFHADLLTSGRRRGRVDAPLSASVHNVLRVVHWTLADVVRWGLPTRNVADFAGICCGVRGHRKSSRTPDVPSGHPVALDRLSRHFRCTTAIGLRIFALPTSRRSSKSPNPSPKTMLKRSSQRRFAPELFNRWYPHLYRLEAALDDSLSFSVIVEHCGSTRVA